MLTFPTHLNAMETSVRATASSLKSVCALWTSLLDHEREALQADIVLAAVNLGARECARRPAKG